MEDVMEILNNIKSGLDSKIVITKEQKEVLDNFVVAYMCVVNNELLKDLGMRERALENLDGDWEKLFEVG